MRTRGNASSRTAHRADARVGTVRARQCWPRSFAAGSAAVALMAAAGGARAQQTDTNPPLPNVLLLIDNSGSMERMIDGSTPETDPSTSTPKTSSGFNGCACQDQGPGKAPLCPDWTKGNTVSAPVANRWNTVQTALTGSLQNGFNCVAMPRTPGSTFDKEYQINGSAYDINYFMPVHRLVSHDPSGIACVVAPGGLPGATLGQQQGGTGAVSGMGGAASDFPAGAIVAREYGLLPGLPGTVACTTTGTQGAVAGFLQYPDGAITTMRDLMRFGMMTFDSDPDPGTGVSGAYPTATLGPSPFTGMWTYNWAGANVVSPPVGDPPNCLIPSTMAVGARNPSAPPWEGRLVPFPAAATPDLAHQEQRNDQVSSVILASRAYGATPMAGMFASAQYYFLNDPNGPQVTDPYVTGQCRAEYIILLTDGAPNLDLQPSCSAGGKCPFPLPYSATGTAATLYNGGTSSAAQASIKTYVIGFAVSTVQDNGTSANCSQFAQSGALSSQCNCSDPNLPAATAPGVNAGNIGPCCVLQCIARNGGSTQAYFAQSQGDLQNALGSILADIAKNTTTRTTPAYPPASTNVISSTTTPGLSNQSIYLASFNASPGKPWSGDVQRQRSVCTYSGGFTLPPPSISIPLGDDFAQNLATNSPQRTFIVYAPQDGSGAPLNGGVTLRPWAFPGVDNVGLGTVTMHTGPATSVDTLIDPTSMAIPAGGCPYTSTVNGSLQPMVPKTCANMLLDYTFGASFTGPSDFNFVSRANNAFGSIYHAGPVVVGPPGALLQDPGYLGFAATTAPNGWGPRTASTVSDCVKGGAGRCSVVYVATNDGLLHAFWADEATQENNEMWAMLLPGVLPNINAGSYPSSHAFLLDGSPVVKDVVWDRAVTASGSTLGGGDPSAWHTMLIAGYGSSQSGYYAVDVTNPDPSGLAKAGTPPTDPPPPGPVFRWQMTTVPTGNMGLFGARSATPALTTLYMDPTGGTNPREIGVAILPGGIDTVPATQAQCARSTAYSATDPYPVRTSVRCWGNPVPPSGGGSPPPQSPSDFVLGRSVTIVRVDTGEIVRVFARQTDMNLYPKDTVNTLKRFTPVYLDSPMTGTPVVYPNDVGTIATKFFIGDADGTIWRFDLSSSNPNSWTGAEFVDLYNNTVDTNKLGSWNDGQPVQVPPVLSLDPAANLVLNVASGTTDQFDTTGIEYVYSITEKVTSGAVVPFINWWMQPASAQFDNDPGERVSGPMTVFNGVLYFSTFATSLPGAEVCSNGAARIWGRDFVLPADTSAGCAPGGSGSCNRSLGGMQRLTPTPTLPYIEPDSTDSSLAGKVIPGVSIKSTPACASLGTPGTDQYVYGAQHSVPQNYTQQGGYSVFTQIGAKGANGATTKTFEMSVPTPASPTVIDSWAAVLE
jgi:type IV pilus assembly protein PilY1